MIEIGIMMLLLALSGWFVFGGRLQGVSATLMLAYGALSVLTWSAVRFTPRETATAAFILSVIALLGYSRNSGIFALHLGLENILMFQGLIGLVSITSLGLAGEFSFRRNISKALVNYRAASLQTADHWMITDCKGRIIEVNPSFEKISGYSARELIGKNPSILKSGRHDKSYYGEMWKTLTSGQTYKGLTINKKKSGEMFYEIKTISPIKNEHGKITRYLSIAKDITDLKHSEEQLEITKKEFESAKKIQQRLFPMSTPKPPGIEIAGASNPAVATGGDYFDYFALDSGDIILVIGDVTGHGFGPALLMASVRAYLRALAFKEPNILKVITSLNELITSDTDEETFVTLMLARLDPEMRTIEYLSAGHVTCYVLDNDHRVKTAMESSGLPLGVYSGSSFGPSRRADLENGDMVLLITDGMLEAENSDGSPFELERVFESVRASRGFTALNIIERLHKDVLDYCSGECADDITSIAVKIGPEPRGA